MLTQDLREGVRALARHRGFSALVVLTVALGIGATTAIFSVVDGLLLRPPPYTDPHRLGELWTLDRQHDHAFPGLSADAAATWEAQSGLFARMESYRDATALVRTNDEPANVRATLVSPGLLPMLGARPRLGRSFTADEGRADGPPVAIVSERFWHERLGGDPEVIGRLLPVDGIPRTIVGVMPKAFKFPLGTVSLWLPLRPMPTPPTGFGARVHVVVRLAPGVTRDAAAARVDGLGMQRDRERPPAAGQLGVSAQLRFLDEHRIAGANTTQALWVLVGAVAFVMLISCANAASLLLVRGTARQRELAIRGALGASRIRLVQRLLAENLMLAAASGLLGMLLAFGGVRAIVAIIPKEIIDYTTGDVGVDWRALGFATALSLITGLLFGVGPALRASRARASLAVADRTGTGSLGTQRMRSILVAAEMALSVVLLVGAGLFFRSFARLATVAPGFDAEHVLEVEVSAWATKFGSAAARERFMEDLMARATSLPGVRGVTQSGGIAITFPERIEAEGRESLPTRGQVIPFTSVDTGYFATMGIRIIRGRAFDGRDVKSAPPVVIIDPEVAAALWPGADPIGRRLRLDPEEPWLTVVGVAGDVKMLGADDRTSQYGLYYPSSQYELGTYRLVTLRTTGNPMAVATPFRRLVWSMRPDQPVEYAQTGLERFGESLRTPRFVLMLMAIFAAVALTLAAVGLYGVIAYVVAQRTREFGIRIALGARAPAILGGVVGRGLTLAAAGITGGIAVSLAVTRFAERMLFGVPPTDPATIATTATVLIVVSVLAALVPARRASRVSPMVALRED